ncbi:hypothetical protein YTPLAS18_29040 [Nitrospira sp.]|nr:hypothetical protein YTPLAS18_29040 [Nitrospira sp.]
MIHQLVWRGSVLMSPRPRAPEMVLLLALLVHVSPVVGHAADRAQQQMVDQARATLEAFTADPKMKTVFHELAPQAKALLILPDYFRWGLVVGGASGTGVLMVREEHTGYWSQPAFYNVSSLNLGPQVGANVSEIVVVIRSDQVVRDFYEANFKLGGSAGLAAGSSGKGTSAHGIPAEVVAYARETGLFAGVAFGGALVTIGEHANGTYYGKPVSPRDIIEGRVKNPGTSALREAARALLE